MTTFEDTDNIEYTIALTGKQIRQFLADTESGDVPNFMWLEEILKKATQRI